MTSRRGEGTAKRQNRLRTRLPYVPQSFREVRVPVVPVLGHRPNPSQPERALVYVPCPYCAERHTHDVDPAAAPDFGHRLSSCSRPTQSERVGYFIKGELS